MFCLIQFYYQIRQDIFEYQPFLKLLSIKLVIFFVFWQTVRVLSSYALHSYPPYTLIDHSLLPQLIRRNQSIREARSTRHHSRHPRHAHRHRDGPLRRPPYLGVPMASLLREEPANGHRRVRRRLQPRRLRVPRRTPWHECLRRRLQPMGHHQGHRPRLQVGYRWQEIPRAGRLVPAGLPGGHAAAELIGQQGQDG